MSKAILIGVSDYKNNNGCSDLPLCKNDIYAVEEALINGLNYNKKDIILHGEKNIVNFSELKSSFNNITHEKDETFIFYFSGHGAENILCLSDVNINLEDLISYINKLDFKNKIIILDCCHAGSFSIPNANKMDINKTVDLFVGCGYAVFASCGSLEKSGFHPDKKLSLYTSIFCDAIQFRSLIKNGKKSLEEIQETIYNISKMWNRKKNIKIQFPIFRQNIGGTIYFQVEEYKPYLKEHIYEDTDEYIIYDVDPLHTFDMKRYAVKVILRQLYDVEKISEIAREIIDKAMTYEVYNNKKSEISKKGKMVNIIWCYFAYDESDVINSSYAYITTWVDDSQDKIRWYHLYKNCFMIENIHFNEIGPYNIIKSLRTTTESNETLINMIVEITNKLTNITEEYISLFREFQNKNLMENELIEKVKLYNKQINELYLKLSDIPKVSDDLHDLFQIYFELCSCIYDFSLYYNEDHLNKWDSKNRMFLFKSNIKKYQKHLEKLKEYN